jgi:hypothetical protein
MKKREALAEHLFFEILLDSESLFGVEWPETFLQFAQNIFVHPAILLMEKGSIKEKSSTLIEETALSESFLGKPSHIKSPSGANGAK